MKKGRIRTKEKAKRQRRKSGWKHYLVLFFVLIALYFSLGRYFGNQAEQAFRQYLGAHAEILGEKLIRIELLDYRSNLLGAKARLRLSSDIQSVAERIGEVNITARLLQGPVFITKQGISTGSSRWLFSVDELNSTESELENLRVLFPENLPKVIVRTDFKHQAHYFSRLETSFAKLIVSGFYQFATDQKSENNHGSIQLEKLHLGIAPNTIQADTLSISYQQNGQAVSAAYKPGVTALRSPAVLINHSNLKQAVLVSLVAKSDLAIEEGLLKGFVQLDIKQPQADTELPFESAKASLRFDGLSAEGMVALSESKAELDNLKQQVNWTLEDMGEYPEGRDELIELNEKIKLAHVTLNTLLFNKMFSGKNSVFKVEVSSQQDENNSIMSLIIAPHKNEKASQSNLRSTLIDGEITGSLSHEWQQYLSRLVHKMGKSEVITVKKRFKVDLESTLSLFE
jgi:hypothetical protein